MNNRLMPQTQIAEIMGRMACLSGLSAETLHRLASGAKQFSIARNESLYNKGDAANDLHIVVSGQIKVYMPLGNSTEKVVALVGNGECVSVAAPYLGEIHATSALARQDSHVLAVDRNVLVRQACMDSGLACRLLGAVSRHKLGLMLDLESCTPRSSLQRVCCFLLQHRPHPHAKAYEFLLPTTKREVAARLNLAQETLSRVFHQLSGDAVIEVQGRLIHVRDSAKLIALSVAACAAD
jgi:CRP-like cAMP-binding protein